MRRASLMVVAAAAATLASTWALAADRALLIGIGAYSGDAAPLEGPANDLVMMRDLVETEMGFAPEEVLVLSDAQASRPAVLAAFQNWLIAGTGPNDRVFIYYSGHGTQIYDEVGGDEGPEGMDEALVMVDYDRSDPLAGLVTDDEIGRMLDQLADRRVTMLVDACHSGTVSRSLAGTASAPSQRARFVAPISRPQADGSSSRSTLVPDGSVLRRDTGLIGDIQVPSKQRLEVWSASAPYQLAWETMIDGRSHGVFSYHFATALREGTADTNQNGTTSREELLSYLAAEADAFCKTDFECQSKGFTPQLSAPPVSRILSVVEWPEDNPQPVTAPSVAQMLDLLTGGREDAALSLVHMDPGKSGPIRGNDIVAFEISSDRDGEVLLFDLRDGGQVMQLFPSRAFAKNTPVAANRVLRIPDAYTRANFRIPSGSGTLLALVVHDRGLVEELSQRNRDLTPIQDPMTFFGELMRELNGTWHNDSENRKVEFGIAQLPYKF
ncbi:caspase family protein [uncultured Roseobacter sp.]|uniref:caspase family protein n=1 Tax=uncultured Roseobacter sp. TaxID=114847 RepID=UPI0026124FAA|nr:caspase family protein [uncultured Roseobacter sp.]